jgi:hypothetical protein
LPEDTDFHYLFGVYFLDFLLVVFPSLLFVLGDLVANGGIHEEDHASQILGFLLRRCDVLLELFDLGLLGAAGEYGLDCGLVGFEFV